MAVFKKNCKPPFFLLDPFFFSFYTLAYKNKIYGKKDHGGGK
jgi:hypothetical protein